MRHLKSLFITILCLASIFLPIYSCAGINNIEEEDGSPSIFPWKLKVPNASLTNNGDGTASLGFAAALASTFLKLDGTNSDDTVGPFDFFKNAVIGAGVDGHIFKIYRNTLWFKLGVDANGNGFFNTSDNTPMIFQPGAGDQPFYIYAGGISFNEFFGSNNPYFKQFGYITAASARKYIQWIVSDTTDNFELTRQDSNVLGFDIQMPLITDAITATGTVTADALTLGADELITLGTKTLKYETTRTDFILGDDLIVEDIHPGIYVRSTDDNVIYGWHYHPNSTYPFGLWKGTDTGSGIAVNPDIPLVYTDNNNNWGFDDKTLFIDAVTNRIGIGTKTPTENLEISSDSDADLKMSLASNVNDQPGWIIERMRGTHGAPLSVQDADLLGAFQAGGYDGSAYVPGADIIFIINGTPSSGVMPADIQFRTFTAGTGSSAARLTIKNAGNVGIRTTAPLRALDINEATGNCLRLIYNDADGSPANYADLLVSSTGDLTINASGGDISFGNENLLTTGTLGAGTTTLGTGSNFLIGTTQWNSGDSIDGTKVANGDLGDISVSSGSWTLDNSSVEGNDLSFKQSKSFVITSPTASSDYPIWKAPYAVTITNIHVLCTGGTNIVGGLDEADANGANAVAVDADITGSAGTNANDDGSLTNPTIDANDYVNWHTTSISGTPTSVTVTFEYTID